MADVSVSVEEDSRDICRILWMGFIVGLFNAFLFICYRINIYSNYENREKIKTQSTLNKLKNKKFKYSKFVYKLKLDSKLAPQGAEENF